MDPIPKVDFPSLPQPQPTKTSNVAITTPSSPTVIVLGLTRTGSTSMLLSLQALGYKCSNQNIRSYQLLLQSDIPAGNRKWYAALRAKYFGEGKVFKKEDWEGFLGGYDAVTDYPAGAFVEELITYFPTAKIILTSRPTPSWFQSMNSTIIPAIRSPVLLLLQHLDPYFVGSWISTLRATVLGVFGPNFEEDGRRIYEEHNALVRKLVPVEKLLEFSPGDGWEPLCRFLGREPPIDRTFPKVNSSKHYQERTKEIIVSSVRRVARNFAGVGLLVGGTWAFLFLGTKYVSRNGLSWPKN